MNYFKIFFISFLLVNFDVINAKLSDQRLCANKDCTEAISLGKTISVYNNIEEGILSFPPNADVTIYSKSAGTRSDLWGVEIKGKRGYVPKSFVREYKIFVAKLKHLVPTEINDKSIDNIKPDIVPDSVTKNFEVVEGTTFYRDPIPTPTNYPEEEIQKSEQSLVENNIEPTLSITPDPKAHLENLNQKNSEEKQKQVVVDSKSNDNILKTEDIKIESQNDAIKTNKVEEVENTSVFDSIKSLFNNDDDDDNDVNEEEENSDEYDDADVSEGDVEEAEEIEEVKYIQEEDSIPQESNVEAKTISELVEKTQTQTLNKNNNETLSKQSNESTEKEFISNVPSNAAATEIEARTILSNSQNNQVPTVQDSFIKIAETTPKPNLDNQINKENDDDKVKNSDNFIHAPPSIHMVTETPSPELPRIINVESTTFAPIFEPVMNLSKSVDSVTISPNEVKKDTTVQINENVVESVSESKPDKLDNDIKNDLPQTNFKSNVDTNVNNLQNSNLENIITEDKIISIETETSTQSSNNLNIHLDNHNPTEKSSILLETETQTVPETQMVTESQTVTETQTVTEIPIESGTQSDDYIETAQPIIAELKTDPFTTVVESSTASSIENEAVPILDNEIVDTTTVTVPNLDIEEEPGLFTKLYNYFRFTEESTIIETLNAESVEENQKDSNEYSESKLLEQNLNEKPFEKYLPKDRKVCEMDDNNLCTYENSRELLDMQFPINFYILFLYLGLTAMTVLLFTLGHYYIEKKRNDGTLISSINDLEKKLLVTSKENLLLKDELKITKDMLSSMEDSTSNDVVLKLQQDIDALVNEKNDLEEQNTNLEKELESATEVGMNLNKMFTDLLSMQNGNESLIHNVEDLQKQLLDQQSTINSMKNTLGQKNTENELLQTELSVTNEKISQLQEELDKMVFNLLSVQEEKSKNETEFEDKINGMREQYENKLKKLSDNIYMLENESIHLKNVAEENRRALELKTNEYSVLQDSMKQMKSINSDKESFQALLDVSKIKAEVVQLREEKRILSQKFESEQESKRINEEKIHVLVQEVKILKDKYEEADKGKVEACTRLEVLSAYFKEKEAQLQKEINENESMWMQKQGEATSTIERIKWIQEELQNYKSQNELLKKEILDQEVSLKSQISVLEKKAHDNWLLARQAERRLEESKQEASQLRNRLTVVEKNLNNNAQLSEEVKLQNRMMSPLEMNGELALSPNSGSPPLMFPHPRDHLTTSPPLPFMPPPPPFIPPFMPPPPTHFPGDHRPPPLGRMSSPPLPGRYSPYDDSPPDSDYGRGLSPPPSRPYRSKQRPPPPRKGLSGSGHSDDSLDNGGRHSGRV